MSLLHVKKVATGEIYDTEVVRLKRKSFLSKFNKKTVGGWPFFY